MPEGIAAASPKAAYDPGLLSPLETLLKGSCFLSTFSWCFLSLKDERLSF